MCLSSRIVQGLRKGAIVIVDGLHVPGNARVVARTTDNADGRRPSIEFTPGDLDAAVVETQCPLALKAVSNTCAYAATTVVADVFVLSIQ